MKSKKLLVLLLLIPILWACASNTPKKLSASFMATYNSEYESYKTQAARCLASPAPCTADEKKLLQQKKKILMDAWPLIATFDLAAAEGKVPDPALQAQILNLINQLTQKGGTK